MRKYIWPILIGIPLILASLAQSEIVTASATGEGMSRYLAIQDGLKQALMQRKGVQMVAREKVVNSTVEMFQSRNGKEYNYSKVDDRLRAAIQSATGGYIRSYDVVSVEKAEGGNFQAKLRVRFDTYRVPGGNDKRRRMAVLRFRPVMKAYRIGGKNVPGKEVVRQLSQNLVTDFTQTRKFCVYDREYVKEYAGEKALLLSSASPMSELNKLGQVLGVDYMIVGSVATLKETATPYKIEFTGDEGTNWTLSAVVSYRIIVMATRQVKWSDTVTLSMGNEEIGRLNPTGDPAIMRQLALNHIAEEVVRKATENIYPPQVVNVTGNQIMLNQGGTSFKVGDMVNVFAPGKKVIDPYTKESLGVVEVQAGVIQITRVTAKVSYGKPVGKLQTPIKRGFICRRFTKEQIAELDAPQNTKGQPAQPQPQTGGVNTTGSGGVKLPFD